VSTETLYQSVRTVFRRATLRLKEGPAI